MISSQWLIQCIAFTIVDDIHRLGGRFLTKDHKKHASNMTLRHYARRFGSVWMGRRPLTRLCVTLREKDHCVESLQSAAARLFNVEDDDAHTAAADESRTRTAKRARND